MSPDLPILSPLTLEQQLAFLSYLLHLQIPHADRFLSAVDVVSAQDRVFVRTRRDVDADFGVRFAQVGKNVGG